MQPISRYLAISLIVLVWGAAGVQAGPFDDGQAAYNKGDYATALKFWRPLGEQGNADAQISLGWMYETGQAGRVDDNEALQWFRRAAAQGRAKGQIAIGYLYQTGKGVGQDMEEAAKWF